MHTALRTTYISCVARLFGLVAERFFLCLSPTDFRWTCARTNCLHRIWSSLFANIFNPLSLVNLLLLVLLIMRLAHISGSGRDRTQSACEWRQSDSGRVYWTCVYEQEEDAFEWPSLGCRIWCWSSCHCLFSRTPLGHESRGHRRTLCRWSKRDMPRLPESRCGSFRARAGCWSACISA